MPVDLRLLRAFLAVADEGNVTRAAEQLYLSQPALSGQVRRLERQVGTSLFVRSATGMSLTDAGRALLPRAHEAATAIELGIAEARAAAGEERIRIDVHDASLAVPRRLLARLEEAGLALEVTARSTREQVRRLAAGRLDLALAGRSTGGLPDSVVEQVLLAEPLGVAVPSDHPAVAQGSVTIGDLRDEVHYLPRADYSPEWREMVENLCLAAGFKHKATALTSESALLPMDQVAAGRCVAISLLSTAVSDGVAMVPLAGAPDFEWMIRRRAGRPRDGVRRAIALLEAGRSAA